MADDAGGFPTSNEKGGVETTSRNWSYIGYQFQGLIGISFDVINFLTY